jgi:hypothetical protein|nr:zinc ribbon domain-containing protein [Kofleriaceae bacterium]
MANEICTRCGTRNDDGAKFCEGCGASMAAQIHCPGCNAMNPLGRAFCTRCGGSLEHAGWGQPAEPGAVIDGDWQRGGDELIRRVDPDEARRFLGTRTVRVPVGTVGVVLVDGVVDRVLAPGERTSVSLFERVRSFFAGRERTAFYLVDQRPFPVPFVVRTRPSRGGEVVKTQVMVTFLLPKGDRDALAQFIDTVMRGRASVSTGDLYNEVRPEVARVAQEVLERQALAGDPASPTDVARAAAPQAVRSTIDYAAAEAEIRRQLSDGFARRYGLTVDATLAPLTTVASLDLMLGAGAVPVTRACTKCKAELPMSMRFCDRCGERQPQAAAGATEMTLESPLFTSDGQQVELDVIVRAQGQHDDFTASKVAPAVVAAVSQYLRGQTFTAVSAPGGFAALEAAVAPATSAALTGLGMTLVALAVVDARSKTGQWLLSARADLERAAEDVRLGLSWLEQRDNELDLEQLVIARVLREQQQRRDQRFAEASAAVDDRTRRESLAARGAAMDVAQVQRDHAVASAKDAADIARRRTAVEAELTELRARRDLDFAEVERRKRLELEMAAIAEQQQVEKLRAMAQLDREGADQEQAHVTARRAQLAGLTPEQMIAMQAAELSKSEGGGGAWAQALSARAQDEARHAAEQRGIYDKSLAAMAQVAASRAEAAPVVAAPVVQVHAAATRACAACGAAMTAAAKFCPSCGVSG